MSLPDKSPRLVSLRVLEETLKNSAYAGIALSDTLNGEPQLTKNERAFITEASNGVLRNLSLLDYVIAQFSNVPLKKIKPVLLNILRLSVYEILFMDAPDYAACSEAVNAAKARGYSGLSGFVNGVLRSIVRNKGTIAFPDEKTEPVSYLCTVFSHPKWLVERWLNDYGYDFTKQMLAKNNEPPDVTICVNTLKTDTDALIRELLAEGVSAEKSAYAENALILKSPGSIVRLESYKKGYFHVQDTASQIAVKLLAPENGDIIADLCAAPGGKSFLAAYMMENKGKIYARDIHTHKIRLIEEGAKRLGISIIETREFNAEKADEALTGKAGCVILDVPCSGLGVIRKKPDIKLNRKPEDIIALQKIQRGMLSACAGYVKPGGSLLYSTCTLTAEENEDNVSWFLGNFDFEPADITLNVPEGLAGIAKGGSLTLFPHIHGTDGFFVCKLKRKR